MGRVSELFVRVELGNDVMQTSKQVADTLRRIAQRLEDTGYMEDEEIQSLNRGVMDTNGNSVGEWGFR